MKRPLGHRCYGSIPHLPGSRTGPSDRHIDVSIAARLIDAAKPGEEVLVREKLDGSCVGVARIDDAIVALGRAGDLAAESRNEGRRLFARWVDTHADRFLAVLEPGERLVGEWLALAHATRYALHHEPFVAFDLMRGSERASTEELTERAERAEVVLPALLHHGAACSVELALERLGTHGHHGALDVAEGAVWRLEREGTVLHVAKFVRPGKEDGVLLPDHSGEAAVWNWREERGGG